MDDDLAGDRMPLGRRFMFRLDDADDAQLSTLTSPFGSMNERPAADYVFFGAIFVGFVVEAAALITASVPAALAGAILLAAGLLYFLFRQPAG